MILHIIRGLPGAGKSTFAKTLNCFHVETDMFKYKDGEYIPKSNPSLSKKLVLEMTEMCLKNNIDVVVSNVFATQKSLVDFLALAKKYNATVKIHTMKTQYKTIHNVPNVAFYGFKKNWENVDGETFTGQPIDKAEVF